MSSSIPPEEIRAAAEVHDELGPRYQDAVIESFLEKVGREIDARVDSRLAQQLPGPPGKSRSGGGPSGFPLAIISLVFGIPLSAVAVAAGTHPAGIAGLIVVWAAIVAINVAYNLGHSGRERRRSPG